MAAVNEGIETVALHWMELKQLVHPLRALVLRHIFFLVLIPYFVGGDLCYQLHAGGCVRLAASHTKLLWCKRHPIDCIIPAGLNF